MSNALASALSTSFLSSTLPSASYTTSLLTTQEPIQKGQKEPFSRCFVSQIISQVKARVQIFLHKRQSFLGRQSQSTCKFFFSFYKKRKASGPFLLSSTLLVCCDCGYFRWYFFCVWAPTIAQSLDIAMEWGITHRQKNKKNQNERQLSKFFCLK